MNVLIMGAGGQGAPCASILSRDPDIARIKLCDINQELLDKVAARIASPKLETAIVDASKVDDIATAAQGMDVIIDLVTPVFFFNVLKAARQAKVHYVNTAWEEFLFEGFDDEDNDSGEIHLGAKLKMTDDFKKDNLTAILGCGMTSGYASNVVSRYYVDKLDQVESIKIRLAKKDTTISEEKEILYPWNPGWNPRQALLDFVVPTYKFENGTFIRMTDVFSEPEMWDFPEPIGRTLVSHHSHEEPFSLPHSFAKKGLKYCDFKYYVNKQIAPVVTLGLGQEETVNIKGTEISPLDVVTNFVKAPGDAFLNEDPEQFADQDKTKLTSIMLEIIGTKGDKKLRYLIHVPTMNAPRQKMYDLYGTSLINVALPAAIGAKMAVEGTEKGVISPQDVDPDRFLELMRKTGYPNSWEETVEEI